MEVGIYKLYRLGRLSNTRFDKTIKILERDLHSVHHDYADKINAQSDINGLLYELDEKATKLYWDKKPYKAVKEFTAFEEVKDETFGITSMKTIEEADAEIKEANSPLEMLRSEYMELTGKKAHHLYKEDKLTELIEELKK